MAQQKVILYSKNYNMTIFYIKIKIRAGGGALGQQGGALGQQGASPCYSSLWETLLVITSKLQTVWTPIRSGQNLMPDLGPNCLKGLSADDNVMSRFNAKKKT